MLLPGPKRQPFSERVRRGDFPVTPTAHREESDRVHMLITLLFHGLKDVFTHSREATTTDIMCRNVQIEEQYVSTLARRHIFYQGSEIEAHRV